VANPRSRLTRARLLVARWLEPEPDPGEAWCMGCSLNGGVTVVLPADGHRRHAQAHADADGDHIVAIRVTWPEPLAARPRDTPAGAPPRRYPGAMTCDDSRPDAAFLEEVGVLADGWRAARAARDRAAADLAEAARPARARRDQSAGLMQLQPSTLDGFRPAPYGTASQHNMSGCTAAMAAGTGRCGVCGWVETGGGLPWSDPRADVTGDIREMRAQASARYMAGRLEAAGHPTAEDAHDRYAAAARALAGHYSDRTGLPVTVFTAATPIEAGHLVTLLDGETVMQHTPDAPGDMGHGVALADACAAGLVPVVLRGSGGVQAGYAVGGLVQQSPDPAAIGDAAFAPRPAAAAGAEQDVMNEALERGEDPGEALAAYRRRPGPLEDQPDLMPLVVAPGPGPHRQAWRMTAVGVWFAYAGEPCAEFLPEGDPARPERVTAAQLRARLAAP
jgi:hypothetical protein